MFSGAARDELQFEVAPRNLALTAETKALRDETPAPGNGCDSAYSTLSGGASVDLSVLEAG